MTYVPALDLTTCLLGDFKLRLKNERPTLGTETFVCPYTPPPIPPPSPRPNIKHSPDSACLKWGNRYEIMGQAGMFSAIHPNGAKMAQKVTAKMKAWFEWDDL